jgi:hypothetical protein
MGTTPRLHLSAGVSDEDAGDLPQLRDERNCMPSQTQARKLLSKCIELPRYAHWSFDDYFNKAALAGKAEAHLQRQRNALWRLEGGLHLQSRMMQLL